MCALPSPGPRHASIIKERNKVSTTIKERNKVSTASAYYLEQRRAADCGRDQRKNRQDRKRKQEAEREWRNHKESQRRWCRASTCQTTATYGKPQSPWKVGGEACHVPASDKHYWKATSSNSSRSGDLSFFLDIFVFSCQTSKFNCRLLDSYSHIIHVLPKRAPHYIRMCVLDVLLHNLATRGFWVNLHLVILQSEAGYKRRSPRHELWPWAPRFKIQKHVHAH